VSRAAAHNFADLMTVRDAAAYLGVSPGTLRAWDAQGKLPARRHPINGYRLYDRASLDAVLERLKGGKR
jgi:excisionase family DNA binding protein